MREDAEYVKREAREYYVQTKEESATCDNTNQTPQHAVSRPNVSPSQAKSGTYKKVCSVTGNLYTAEGNKARAQCRQS